MEGVYSKHDWMTCKYVTGTFKFNLTYSHFRVMIVKFSDLFIYFKLPWGPEEWWSGHWRGDYNKVKVGKKADKIGRMAGREITCGVEVKNTERSDHRIAVGHDATLSLSLLPIGNWEIFLSHFFMFFF